jgi:hypothetical protein
MTDNKSKDTTQYFAVLSSVFILSKSQKKVYKNKRIFLIEKIHKSKDEPIPL